MKTSTPEISVIAGAQSGGSLPKPVCWVLISLTPYHHARFAAFAETAEVPPVLFELKNHDPFQCLEFSASSSAYVRCSVADGLQRFQQRLFHRLDEIAPGVVCVNGWSLPGSVETLLWCVRRRVPAVVFSESTAIDSPRSWWKESIKSRLLSLASAALVGGAPHAAYIRGLGVPSERIFQGYDAVDNDWFETGADAARRESAVLRARFGLPQRYFLACCRFEPKKNLNGLVKAYALYRAQAGIDAWPLVLAGDGSQRAGLESLVASLDIRSAVIFVGARSYAEMPVFYGLASAFIHASTTEQWGLVANEAAAAGLPLLISANCGCATDLVRHGVNGLLFDPYDVNAIARAMTLIASDESDRKEMGRAAREIARAWSPRRFANGLNAAIRVANETPVPEPGLATLALLRTLLFRR